MPERSSGRAVRLEGFAAEAIDGEAVRLGVSAEQLASFSVLYYLADFDSGRIARRIPAAPIRVEEPKKP